MYGSCPSCFWTYGSNTDGATNNESSNDGQGILVPTDQRHMLRCVHFPPGGDTIIIGGVNPTTDDPRRRQRGGIGGGGMSFYLRLWDFDMQVAQMPPGVIGEGMALRRPITNVSATGESTPRRCLQCAITNRASFLSLVAPNLCSSCALVQ